MTTAAQVAWIVTSFSAHAALSRAAFCSLDRAHLGDLIEEVARPWAAQRQSALRERRGHDRQRTAGAGPNHQLVFVGQVLITLVYLRLQLPHAALAELYGMTRPTVTRIHEIRSLLARRGFAVPQRPGARLHTLADVFAYAAAERVDPRVDGIEGQVRRPRAGRAGRKAFVSGKKKQNSLVASENCTLRSPNDELSRNCWLSQDGGAQVPDVPVEACAVLAVCLPAGYESCPLRHCGDAGFPVSTWITASVPPSPRRIEAVRDIHPVGCQPFSHEPQIDRARERLVGAHPDTESTEWPGNFPLLSAVLEVRFDALARAGTAVEPVNE
ncbi:helix-turn-helix domain-containing protein [Streptomyces sp. NPDC001118]